jgi:hypothetical protein
MNPTLQNKVPSNYLFQHLIAGVLLLAGLVADGGGAEPEVVAEGMATLGRLAKIPASEFTKVMDNSVSPNKQLAVALGSKDGKKPVWVEDTREGRGGAVEHSYFLEDCRNYVVDVKADRVMGILDGTHSGTREKHNHESGHIAWSPDSRWLVETRSWKWSTETCTVHRVGARGQLVARLNFRNAASEIVDTWLREHWPKLTAEQRSRYSITVSLGSISNDGSLVAEVFSEIPKSLDSNGVSVSVSAKVEQAKDGELSIRILKVASRE